jgi:hypothetical protein
MDFASPSTLPKQQELLTRAKELCNHCLSFVRLLSIIKKEYKVVLTVVMSELM